MESAIASQVAAEKVLAEKNALVDSLNHKAEEQRADVQALENEQKISATAGDLKST